MSLQIELCVDDLRGVEIASECGIERVELCQDLWCGGLTPPDDLIMEAVAVAPEGGVQVLVREQADTFVLSDSEVDELCKIIERIRLLTEGARVPVGFVIGAVTDEGEIDTVACSRFRAAAGDRPLTFHRAFDQVSDLFAGVDTLVSLGYDRVLTTGGDASVAQVSALRALQERAGDDLTILGSGGLRSHNIAEVVKEAQLREVHMRAPATSGHESKVAGTSKAEAERIVSALTN